MSSSSSAFLRLATRRLPARRAHSVLAGDASAFERVALARRSAFVFDASRRVPPDALRSVLESTLRAPSGFNLVPWRIVIVHDDDNYDGIENGLGSGGGSGNGGVGGSGGGGGGGGGHPAV